MKKIYTFLSLILIGSVAIAQSTITEANMPVIGDNVTIGNCSDIPVPATLNVETGPAYSWDLSGLTEVSQSSFSFIDPAGSYWPTEFASSTICGVEPVQDSYTFYRSSSTMLEADGYRVIIGPGDTVETDYTNSEIILNLPVTFNNSNADNFIGVGYAASTNFILEGTLFYSTDGYGSLQLPNGTYQNVIRYHSTRSESFYVGTFAAGTVTKEQWIWMSADYRFWLALMETITDPINGDSYTVWYQKTPIAATNPTGIADVNSEAFTVYPNPVEANGMLQLSRALTANETVQLFDNQGRMVKSVNAATQTVSLNGVNVGIYLLKITDSKGNAISTQKLIVQ